MPDLVAADLTITAQTIGQGDSKYRIEGNKRKVFVKIAFGDGALTYPANGIPVPAATSFGMYRNLDFLTIVDGDDATGIIWKWDYANKKLRGWRSAGFTPAGTVAAPTFTGSALAAHRHVLHFQTTAAANAVTAAANQLRTGAAAFDVAGVANSAGEGGIVDVTGGTPAGTNSAPGFTGTAVAAGSLVEITGAPAAQVLYAEAVGW